MVCENSDSYVLPSTRWATLNKSTPLAAPTPPWFSYTFDLMPFLSVENFMEKKKPELCVLVHTVSQALYYKGKWEGCTWEP